MNTTARTKLFVIVLISMSFTAIACGGGSDTGQGPEQAYVIEASPPSDAQGIPVTSLVLVHFSRRLSQAEVQSFSIDLYHEGNVVPASRHLLTQSTSILVLDPLDDLLPSTTYEVRGRTTSQGPSLPSTPLERITRFCTSDRTVGGPVFLFDPAGEGALFPYPSDLFTIPDGSSATGCRVRIPHELVPPNISVHDLDGMDGFGLFPRFILPVSSAPDLEMVPRSPEDTASPLSPLFLVDMEDMHQPYVPIFIEIDPFGPYQVPARWMLKVMPLYPLRPAHRYALVVTRRIVAKGGAPAEPSAAFREIVEGRYDENGRGRRAFETIRPILDSLAREDREFPIHTKDLALVVPLTTRSMGNLADELIQIQDYFARQYPLSPPRIEIHSSTTPGSSDHGHGSNVAMYVKGVVETPEFRDEHGRWDHGLIWEDPDRAPRVPLEFLLSLPKKAAEAPSPIVIFLHGINDAKEAMYNITESLASYNIAAIAIDIVEHGSRATTELMPWIPFLRLDALECGRDNMRQTQSDLMNLALAIRTSLAEPGLFFWVEGGRFLDIDPEHIFFVGNSLGSILSPAFLALEDSIKGAALYVGAGNFTEVVTRYEAIQPGTSADHRGHQSPSRIFQC